MNKFIKLFNKILEETEYWEESGIKINSKPLQRLLIQNSELTSKYGFVLFPDSNGELSIKIKKLPKSILSNEKEFVLKMIKELKIPKPIRGKFINLVKSLRATLQNSLEDNEA